MITYTRYYILLLGILLSVFVNAQSLTVKNIGSSESADELIGSNAFTASRGISLDVQEKTGINIAVYTEPDNSQNPSGNRNIFCRIYDKNRNTLVWPFRINKDSTGDQFSPKVKFNQSDNTFVVVWASNHGANGYDIYAKKIDLLIDSLAFTKTKTDHLINTNYVSLGQVSPRLTFDYDYNELIVAWRDNDGQDGSGYGCYARRIDYASFPSFKGNQFILNQSTTDNQTLADIEVSPGTGAFYALYVSYTGATYGNDVFLRKWTRNSSGDLVAGSQYRVNSTRNDSQWGPSLTFNKTTGHYSVGWTSNGQDGSWRGSYFKVYNQADVAQTGEVRANIPTTNNQFGIKTVWDEATGYMIHFYVYSVPGGSTSRVKYQLFTPAYATYGSETDALGGTNTNNIDNVFDIAYDQSSKNIYLGYNIHHTDLSAPSKAYTRYFRYVNSAVLSSDCDTDPTLQWVQKTNYDEYGNVIAEQRTYLDNFGRAKQVQTKNVSANAILAVQNIYDDFGKLVIQTLPAPIAQNCFTYNSGFIKDINGNDYTAQYFGNPVANNTAGTLGHYYSNNNSAEPYVGTTGFPYRRINYTDSIYGSSVVTTSPGDSLRYGKGHEREMHVIPLYDELDSHYLAIRNHFVPTDTSLSLKFQGVKKISYDENKVSEMTYLDKEGRILAKSYRRNPGIGKTELLTSGFYTYSLPSSVCVCEPVLVSGIDSITIMPSAPLPTSIYTVGPPDIITKYVGGENNEISSHGHFYVPTITLVGNAPFNVTWLDNIEGLVTRSAILEPGSANAQFYSDGSEIIIATTNNAIAYSVVKVTNLTSEMVEYEGSVPVTLNNIIGVVKIETVTNPKDIEYYVDGNNYKWDKDYKISVTYTDYHRNFDSYYFYDDAGRNIATVAPKGVDMGSLSFPKYTETYTYSTTGQLLTSYDSDRKGSVYVYRKDGSMRFKQDNKQKQTDKFSYINYDRYGRMVETGEYDPAQDSGSPKLFEAQALIPSDGNSVLNILEEISPSGGLGTLSCSCRTDKINYSYGIPSGDTPLGRTQRFVQGEVSKTSNAHAATWYSYDEQGRIEWTVKSVFNFGGTGITKSVTTDYAYDMHGNVLNVVYMKDSTNQRFEHRYTYNLSQQLVRVQTKAGAKPNYQNEAKYYYYKHGQLKRTELADSLQGIDYIYTVQGWLKSINHPTLTASKDAGRDGHTSGANKHFAPDVFGIQFQYFDGDYIRTGSNITNTTLSTTYKNQYNGLVKASRWLVRDHYFSSTNMGMYAYTYDDKYQLTEGQFGTVSTTAEATFTSSNNYKYYDLSFDANGNILTKKTNNESGSTYQNYAYTVDTLTNRLKQVMHNSSTLVGGFAYDSIGNVVSDQGPVNPANKYTYDANGKITSVSKTYSGNTLKIADFVYDEYGRLLRKIVYNVNPPYTSTYSYSIWYMRDAGGNVLSVYDDNGSALGQKELHVYGKVRMGVAYKNGSAYSYTYELMDHLSNVRATIARERTGSMATILSWADYYPDGQKMPTRSGNSSPVYRYHYQGQFAEQNNQTSYLDFEQRNYKLGTNVWMQPDPMKQNWSSYVGMGNNPVTMVDPDGGCYIPSSGQPSSPSVDNNPGGGAPSYNPSGPVAKVGCYGYGGIQGGYPQGSMSSISSNMATAIAVANLQSFLHKFELASSSATSYSNNMSMSNGMNYSSGNSNNGIPLDYIGGPIAGGPGIILYTDFYSWGQRYEFFDGLLYEYLTPAGYYIITIGSIFLGNEGALLKLFKGRIVVAKGGIKAIEAGSYTFTKTAAKHLSSRPYMNSPSTITNIMKSGKGVPDATFKGGVNYKVPGTFNGSQGVWELGINPQTNTIYHFLFKSVK